MPARTEPLVNDHYYHILNRGVARMPIFITDRDRQRFVDTFLYYTNKDISVKFSQSIKETDVAKPGGKIVEIISYCLMPNHFHFLLKQVEDDGIMNFIRKTTNSYAKYFNTKRERKGPIFEGKFKAIIVETDEQLIHLSRYIHVNPIAGFVVKNLNDYKWSSYLEYLGKSGQQVCSKNIILDQFGSRKSYEKFVLDHVDYAKQLAKIKHQMLEEHH
mgnify:CR=1 FL=1